MKKRQKTRGDDPANVMEEVSLKDLDALEHIVKEEAEFIKEASKADPAEVREVYDNVDDLFKFAVERHNRRVKPPKKRFTQEYPLKDYQEQGLGWLLDREGYVAPGELISPDWTDQRDGTWTNATTGVTVTTRPVMGYTGDGPSLLGEGPKELEGVINSVHGGILADEMGLGKTVQMISLIVTHAAPDNRARGSSKATLVVVPRVLIGTWLSELEKWAPALDVHVHYGTGRDKGDLRPFFQHHVVITTYETLQKDQNLFRRVNWWRVILDEGHRIKNADTATAQALHAIEARNRWIMSGTPIQNTWRDLFSLLKFLRVRPYGEIQGWYRLIEHPLKTGKAHKAQAAENLKSLIQVLVLRRTKKSPAGVSLETGGEPLLRKGLVIRLTPAKYANQFWKVRDTRLKTFDVESMDQDEIEVLEDVPYVLESGEKSYSFVRELVHIPEKRFTPITLGFTPKERAFYDQLQREGLVGDVEITNPLVMLLRLRQAAIHPWLLLSQDKFEEKIERVYASGLDHWEPSSKMSYIVEDIRDTKPGRARGNEKSLIFSQFTRALEILELALQIDGWITESQYQEELAMYRAKYAKSRQPPPPFKYENTPRYVRIDGQTKYAQREEAMKSLREEPNVKLALLSLHATGVGLNLVSANNVYFMDLFFNPQVHAQAIDRTHRIGQDKIVNVKTVVVKDTIEAQLLKLLDYKQIIAEYTLKPFTISKDRILDLLNK